MNSLQELFNALHTDKTKNIIFYDMTRDILHLTSPDIRIFKNQNRLNIIIFFMNTRYETSETSYEKIYEFLSGIINDSVVLSSAGKDILRISGWKGTAANNSSGNSGVLGTLSGLLGSRKKAAPAQNCTDIRAVREKTTAVSRKSVSMYFNHGITPKLTDNKICGLPYWDRTKPYPTDKNGKKMLLLAQFNLEKIPANNILPPAGLLQFFVSDTPMPDYSFKPVVIYHRKPDTGITAADIKKLGIPEKSENSLFRTEYLITFNEKAPAKATGCHLLGVSASDPCDTSEKTSYFGTHLLQLDTEDSYMRYHFNSFKEQTTGSFSFFINENDLKKLDFSNVQIMWHTQMWNA